MKKNISDIIISFLARKKSLAVCLQNIQLFVDFFVTGTPIIPLTHSPYIQCQNIKSSTANALDFDV